MSVCVYVSKGLRAHWSLSLSGALCSYSIVLGITKKKSTHAMHIFATHARTHAGETSQWHTHTSYLLWIVLS